MSTLHIADTTMWITRNQEYDSATIAVNYLQVIVKALNDPDLIKYINENLNEQGRRNLLSLLSDDAKFELIKTVIEEI
jgi:hypothetical protein